MLLLFEELYMMGWRLCARRFHLHKYWKGDLLFANNNLLLILETRRPDTQTAAHITADLLGSKLCGQQLYFGFVNLQGRIRGIHEWTKENQIKTILI